MFETPQNQRRHQNSKNTNVLNVFGLVGPSGARKPMTSPRTPKTPMFETRKQMTSPKTQKTLMFWLRFKTSFLYFETQPFELHCASLTPHCASEPVPKDIGSGGIAGKKLKMGHICKLFRGTVFSILYNGPLSGPSSPLPPFICYMRPHNRAISLVGWHTGFITRNPGFKSGGGQTTGTQKRVICGRM